MENEKTPKTPSNKKVKYYCKKCDFICSNKKDFKRHKMTAKHLRGFHGNKKPHVVDYICEKCGKGYKHRSGLSRHRNKCEIIPNHVVDNSQNVTVLPSFMDNKK